VLSRSFVAGAMWALFVVFGVLTGFAVSAVWGGSRAGEINFGQHMAVVSSTAGPMLIVTVIIGAVALHYTTIAENPSPFDVEDDEELGATE
jgi:uncharacterized membrane protein YhdT